MKKEDYDFLYKSIKISYFIIPNKRYSHSHFSRRSKGWKNQFSFKVNISYYCSSLIKLICRYTKNTIKNTVPTIGVEYATKCVLLKNGAGIVKAQIWDTCNNIYLFLKISFYIKYLAGSEKYKSITTALL